MAPAGQHGGVQQRQEGSDDQDRGETMRLRLDLNIDIDVKLNIKARIHGDVTLALLESG